MNDIAIRADSISKRYRMSGGKRYDTLTESLTKGLFSKKRAAPSGERFEEGNFWALRDISFEIAQGDIVGIVGRNGAGKSTLLKILSNITTPSSGEALVRGRVGSLLEVGTGFNPDLTGRENIFLSAAILGMRQTQIQQRLDEIVAFADVPGFIDTPVKHYSSGMYMRLAFSVAAHLDHEILLVDEVLAVGDAAFQKKCLGKIGEESRSGRTILFVSHSLPAVAALCSRALFLSEGRLVMDDTCNRVLSEYQKSLRSNLAGFGHFQLADVERYGSGKAVFTSVSLNSVSASDEVIGALRTGDDLVVDARIEAKQAVADINPAIVIYDSSGYRITDANMALAGRSLSLKAGEGVNVVFRLKDMLLKPGEYSIGLWVGRTNAEDIDGIHQAVTFNVEPQLDDIRHSAVFPGVYQCRFDVNIR